MRRISIRTAVTAAVMAMGLCSVAQAQVVANFAQLQAAVNNFNNGTGNATIDVMANIDITSTLTVTNNNTSANRTLTIYGYSLVLRRGASGNLFTVGNRATLTLQHTIVDGNKTSATFAKSGGGALVRVNEGGTLIMSDGAVLRNNVINTGGGVRVYGGTFIMNGGEIRDNEVAPDSGATYRNGTGAGVNVARGTFTMNGGFIRGNKAGYGSGVSVHLGTFTMNGGEISGNTADWAGGVAAFGKFDMKGGKISGNSIQGVQVTCSSLTEPHPTVAGKDTAYAACGEFVMSGGEVSGNTGTGVVSYTAFTMTGGKISGNTAIAGGVGGGGVYVSSGSLVVSDGSASYYSSTFTMTGGEISGNRVTGAGCGGGVYVSAVTLPVTGDLTRLYNGTFTMTGGKISGNSADATGRGSGVYLNSGDIRTVGGRQYSANSRFDMTGGEISGNVGGVAAVYVNSHDLTSVSIGGGISATVNGGLILGGAPKIEGNSRAAGFPANVFLPAGRHITLGNGANGAIAPRAGMNVGVTKTADAGIIVQTGAKAGDEAYFFADEAGKSVLREGERLRILTPVTDITGVPAEATAGLPLALKGTVAPGDASYKDIVWTVVDAGTAGGAVSCSSVNNACTLTTTGVGTVTVRATVVNGLGGGADFTKDFVIAVKYIPVTDIIDVPGEMVVFNTIWLREATILPANSTYPLDTARFYRTSEILWSVVDDGGTGAIVRDWRELSGGLGVGMSRLFGSLFDATTMGRATIRATVVNGLAIGTDFTKDFVITVNPIPVTDITGVLTVTTAGDTLPLAGTVRPTDSTYVYTTDDWIGGCCDTVTVTKNGATNRTISWSVIDTGATGAYIAGSDLYAPASGSVKVLATIADGLALGVDFTKEFVITVNTTGGVSLKDLVYDTTAVTYNGRPQGIPPPRAAPAAAGGIGAITVKYDGLAAQPVGVGTYIVTADIAEGTVYGAVTRRLGSFTIKPKQLPGMAFTAETKVYDGTTAATVKPVRLDASNGVFDGDSVVLVAAGAAFASPNAGSGIAVAAQASLNGASALNYAFSSPPVFSGSIVRRELAVSGGSALDKVYDGTPAATVAGTFTGDAVDGDDVVVTVTGAEFASSGAGVGIPVTVRLSLGGASAPNYSLVSPVLTGDILPKPLLPDAVAPIAPQIYTESGVTPQVTVRDGSKVLAPGVDYTVYYVDNVFAGDTAGVTVVGIGNYTGEAFGSFLIVRGGLTARFFAGPSPARSRQDAMNFFWQGPNINGASLRVYDCNGNVVRTVNLRDDVHDNFDKRRVGSWDLRNSRGRYVAGGVYLIRGAFDMASGDTESVSVRVGVK